MRYSVLLDSEASETVREVSYSWMTELLFPCAVRGNCYNVMVENAAGVGGGGGRRLALCCCGI